MKISVKQLFQDIGLKEAASFEDDVDEEDDMPADGTFERVDGMHHIVGTRKIGTISVPFQKLVDKFGEPTGGDNFRTYCEWAVSIVDREVDEKEPVIITIYDWKNFDPNVEVTIEDLSKITEWNVGGHNNYSMRALRKLLNV